MLMLDILRVSGYSCLYLSSKLVMNPNSSINAYCETNDTDISDEIIAAHTNINDHNDKVAARSSSVCEIFGG